MFYYKGKFWVKCNSIMIMKNNFKVKSKWICFWFLKNMKGLFELGWKKIGLVLLKNYNYFNFVFIKILFSIGKNK